MCYWGYKFETLSTVSKPPKDGVDDQELADRILEGADTNVQYCVAVKTTLGKNSLIMGAEVDCSEGIKRKAKAVLYTHSSWYEKVRNAKRTR
jgi:RAT1-interacting protein